MSKGSQRNRACPCGSGKKFKKCCIAKKPRNVSVTMDMGTPVAVDGIRMSSSGNMELLKNGKPLVPHSAYHEISYDRIKGRKVLNKISLDPNNLLMAHYRALQKFDKIFAIDTNTKTVNREVISISCICLCKLIFGSDNSVTAEYAPIHCLEFRNIVEQAENIAWMKAIESIMQNPNYDLNIKIGLVVDSDLGNISAYNNKTLPIYSDFYLPLNFKLIYASADVGKEFVLNKLISLCDKEATKLLEHLIQAQGHNTNLLEVNNEPYSHFRSWNLRERPIKAN